MYSTEIGKNSPLKLDYRYQNRIFEIFLWKIFVFNIRKIYYYNIMRYDYSLYNIGV